VTCLKLYACTLLSPEPTGPAAVPVMRGRTLPFGQKGLIPDGNCRCCQPVRRVEGKGCARVHILPGGFRMVMVRVGRPRAIHCT
jgi:hypothetical protein